MSQQPPIQHAGEPVKRDPVIPARIIGEHVEWDCPGCGQVHREPLRSLVEQGAYAWQQECEHKFYIVHYAPQRLPGLRRRLGIPKPVYPTHEGPYWRLPAEWKRQALSERYHLATAAVARLSERAEQLAGDRGQQQVFARDVESAWREIHESLAQGTA